MAAKLRLLSALCALVAAVIVVWQANPAGRPGGGASCGPRAPMTNVSTTIKWPVIETVDPDPFDPCSDIPLDVVQRIGLAFTPPDPRRRAALPLRRRQLSDGRRGVRLANLRGRPCPPTPSNSTSTVTAPPSSGS